MRNAQCSGCMPASPLVARGRVRVAAAVPSMLPATASSVPAAVAALRRGEVIALPTDTLYGLAASASCAAGVKVWHLATSPNCQLTTPQRLYDIKGRQASVPLAICVADPQASSRGRPGSPPAHIAAPQDVSRCARTQHLPVGLLESLLPGPVTLVLERTPGALCEELNPGLARVGAPPASATCSLALTDTL